MKLSILTPTYNRANLLKKLYNSILRNQLSNIEVEWLIMDDGSSDNTKEVVDEFRKEEKIIIKYYVQENKGKMTALNNLISKVTGDLIIECDSDDFFKENAFQKIDKAYEESKKEKDLYALCFLKSDTKGKNIGNEFKNNKTTMFDLYFKEKEDGEKALVFFSDIRKQYKYELEESEKFITEARMYHKMDLKYKMKCFNETIMICEYQKDGYTKNIQKIFKENPKGYFKYFEEILKEHNMSEVKFKKRLYVIKHYILFSYLSKNKKIIRNVKGLINKIIIAFLYFPGIIKASKF